MYLLDVYGKYTSPMDAMGMSFPLTQAWFRDHYIANPNNAL